MDYSDCLNILFNKGLWFILVIILFPLKWAEAHTFPGAATAVVVTS
jgi:hypothetical protein